MLKTMASTVALVALAWGFTSSVSDNLAPDGQPAVYGVESDHPGMNAAISEARQTVHRLTDRFQSLLESDAQISVKVAIESEGYWEHIWLANVELRDGKFYGVLGNVPVNLPGWAMNDPVSVMPDQISDWMVIEDGDLFGGYTLFVLLEEMSVSEQSALSDAMGLAFPAEPRSL